MASSKDIPPVVDALLSPFVATDIDAQRPRVIAERMIESARVSYELDGNPLHAWRGYIEARQSGEPVPDWVSTYLDRCAVALLNMATAEKHVQRDAEPSTAIAEAFEMKRPGRSGRGSVFSEFKNNMWLVYGSMVAHNMRHGDKQTHAIEDVARANGVSVATVRRAYKKYKTFTKSATS